MTSANVPEVDTIIASFTNKIPKIQGAPDFSSLSELKQLLGSKPAEKDTTLGHRANGYLGLILTVAEYNTIAPGTPFITPIFPDNQPIIPAGATAAQIAKIICMHTELMRQWKECQNVDAVLKKQLINSIDEIYIQSLWNRMNGYANVTTRTMLDHLIQHYDGCMQPKDMTANIEMLNHRWDPSMPIETLIKQVEDCRDFAEDGNSQIQTNTLTNLHTLTFSTLECTNRNATSGSAGRLQKRLGLTSRPISWKPNTFRTYRIEVHNKEDFMVPMLLSKMNECAMPKPLPTLPLPSVLTVKRLLNLLPSLNSYKLKTGHSRKRIMSTVKMELDVARSNPTTVNVDIAGLMDSVWCPTTTVKHAGPKPMVTRTMQPRRTQCVEVPIPIDEVRQWQV
jgi:hypothetical protein